MRSPDELEAELRMSNTTTPHDPTNRSISKDSHPGVELRVNPKSISHRFHLFEVAFVWELTKETMHLPLGCLQGMVNTWFKSVE